jgi:hypothetical protein
MEKLLLVKIFVIGKRSLKKFTMKRYNLPDTSTLTTTIYSLMRKNLIQKNNRNYEIINPVFEEWIRTLY